MNVSRRSNQPNRTRRLRGKIRQCLKYLLRGFCGEVGARVYSVPAQYLNPAA